MATSLATRYATKYLCKKWLLPSSTTTISRSFTTTKDKEASSTVRTSILGEHIDELEQEYSFDRSLSNDDGDFVGVRGHSSVIDKADFVNARIGDVLEIPYEVTASDFWRVCCYWFKCILYMQLSLHICYIMMIII